MIVALSVRYRKHIAALLFSVFYLELYASAHTRYSEWEETSRYANTHRAPAASAETPESAPVAGKQPSVISLLQPATGNRQPNAALVRVPTNQPHTPRVLQPDSAASGGPT